MEKPPTHLTSHEVDRYRQSALLRQIEAQTHVAQIQGKAWDTARYAAEKLRQQFLVTRVVVFGSLVHEGCFTRWSDVDIAAWGIPPEDTFRAVGVVMDTSDEFVINLVDVNIARPSLLGVIEQEGIEI
jgi:predicted nucleotidyltransferase